MATKKASSNEMPTIKLNTGATIPMLAYGTGTALFKTSDPTKIDRPTINAIKTAITAGFHHLDGAELYNTEPELGIAIAECGLPRSSLFITTKVINSIASISTAIDVSLSKLGLTYVDLYLIHSPWFATSDADLQRAWAEMEKVQRAGKARAIGVSNYLQQHLEATLKTASIVPAVNQVEFHPYLQRQNLVPWSRERGIVTAAYGPLTALTKARPGPVDGVVRRLAGKYGVGEEAVLLRWCVDQGVVAVTTSWRGERLVGYLGARGFELEGGEVEEICRKGEEKHFRGNGFMHTFDPDDRS